MKILKIIPVFFLFFSISSMAQNQLVRQGQEQVDITESKVKVFVSVLKDVKEVSNKYKSQIKAAEDLNVARAIQRKSQEEMLLVIDESPLTIDEYQMLVTNLNTNRDFRKEVETYFE
tara:strand:- start:2057 stop:2407 length:351 start_codon:yes stop_codon:yes gene_type:complete